MPFAGRNSPIWYIPCLDEAKALIEKLDSSNQDITEIIAGLYRINCCTVMCITSSCCKATCT